MSRGDERYTVLLNRAETVGREYAVHATGYAKQRATFALPGEPPQEHVEEFGVELDAIAKVLEVDEPTGEATRVQYTISRCVRDGQPLLPLGAVFTAESRQGNTTFITDDGAAVDPATARALEVVIETHQRGISMPQKRVRQGSIAGTFRGLFPVNPTAMPISASKNITIHLSMTVDGPQGQPLDATTVVERSSELRFRPVA